MISGTLGSQEPVHPNDHVNMGQSSNDTFPTAMHIAAYRMATDNTIPALKRLRDATERNAKKWHDVVKIGRTHLEDATPLTVGQEWSGYTGALDDAVAEVEHATRGLLKLAMGGTAVGTGLNAPPGFGEEVAAEIASMTGAPFETAANKFTAQGTLDRMVRAHGGLKAAAVTLFKIAQSEQERAAADALATFRTSGIGYLIEQDTRPQTIGYALADSPVALAAWMLDHDTDAYYKISRAFTGGQPSGGLTRDHILDNITVYWLTGTGASAARSYWESAQAQARAAGQAPPEVKLPVGFTTFPGEIFRAPRSWVEKAYPNLTYFNEAGKGGHFAAWEEPEVFATEIRAAFRSLR